MALFVSFIAGLLVGVAVCRTPLPLRRSVTTLAWGRALYVRAGAVVASFAVASAILYFALGSHQAPERPPTGRGAATAGAAVGTGTAAPGSAKSMESEVAGLEARLARGGGTPADWALLARAYDFLGRPEDAKRARAKAGNAGSVPAVWQMGAGGGTLALAATAGSLSASPRSDATPASNDARAEVSGTVSLDARFVNRVQPDSTLFVYAKAADSPGPPLAVLRTTVGGWPVRFRLDDSMAMIPSRRLSQFDRVVVEARISRSGQAAPAAGDLYVTSEVLRPAAATRLALVINREIG